MDKGFVPAADKVKAGLAVKARMAALMPDMRLMTDPLMTYAYSGDASFYRLVPALVAVINTEAEVAALMVAARAEGLPITFRAAGTSLSGQAVTDGVLAVLGDGWRKIVVHDGAGQITLGPSIIVDNANRALKPFNRKIGPDPASAATCKIGGVVANNSSGMCCGVSQNTYHTMARLRLMLADGTVLDSGDSVSRESLRAKRQDLLDGLSALHAEASADAELVALIRRKYAIKNTIGYALNALIDFDDPIDILTHLMVGSEGTLGFVSEVTYNTVPDHPHKATALVPFPDAYSCARGIARAEKAGVSAAEFIERRALATVADKPAILKLLPTLTETSPAVLIEVMTGDGADLAQAVARARDALLAEGALVEPDFTTVPSEQAALWDVRKGLIPSSGATRPKGTIMMIEDCAVPIDSLPDFVGDLRGLLDAHGYEDATIFGHALAGNLHFQMAEDFSRPGAPERFDRFSDALSELVSVTYGGSLKAEHGTGRAVAAYVEAEWGRKAYALMHRIKALFDPENRLNPGVLLNADPKVHLKSLKTMTPADPIADLCIECGFCEPACPSAGLTLSPRQRIAVTRERARLSLTGEDAARLEALDEDFGYAGLDTCAACNLCSLRCPVGIETGTLILGERARRRGPAAERLAEAVAGALPAVETTMRLALGAQDAARAVIGDAAVDGLAHGLRRLTGNRIPRTSPAQKRGMGVPRSPTPNAAAPRGKVLYFPACPSRLFGAPTDKAGMLAGPEAMLALLVRAGYEPVLPEGLNGACCGQPFLSKGFPEVAQTVEAGLRAKLEAAGSGLTVLTDAATCAKHLNAAPAGARVTDSAAFLAEHVLPHVTVTRPLASVAVHHNCSAQHLKEQAATETLARAAAGTVTVLSSITCCGYAGDKGMLVPELNAHATRFARAEIPAGCQIGVSTVSTCAMGLSERVGIPFVPLASLLEYVTRP